MSDTADVLTRADAQDRARLIDDVAYEVTLELGDGRGEVFGSTTRATFACREPGAATFVDLTAPELVSVTLNGRDLPVDGYDGRRVRLHDLAAANTLEIVARCRYQHTGTGLHRFVDPADDAVYLHTQFEPFDAHSVYACFDQPDIKARFQLTALAPAHWTVVSNEPVASRSRGSEGVDVWEFAATPLLSPYITALVAGPLHAVVDDSGDVPLGLYSRESLAQHLEPEEMFAVTRAGMAFYAEVFGRPYPFTKYDQLFVPEFNWGAMENAGCVTFSESYLFRSRVTDAARTARAATTLHELGHMWFGDLVTMRWWGDLWLNESFATYVSFWALAERTDFTSAWVQFINRETTWAIEQDQLPTTHPIVADAPDTDTAINNFDGITYAKGAMVLRQLVAWVGVDAFTTGLQDYFARHAWGNATLADFLTALEKASGRPLATWGRQWLETTGIPTLQLEVTLDDRGRYGDVAVVQHAPDGQAPRDQRVVIGLYDADGDALVRRDTVALDVTGERTPVPQLAGQARADMLLPNDGLYSYAKVTLDDASLATLRAHLGDVTEPLTRAHCWLIAWDLVRDAELPAHQYAAMVADHAPREHDSEMLRTLLAHAQHAVSRYGHPQRRADGRARLAATARDALAASPAGSDEQLVWARCRVAVEEDPAWALGLLDGTTAVDGLVVDHDLRWYTVIQLARRDAIDADAIARELERDPTDEGARHATTARAARPLAEAKAQAWDTARDHTKPLAVRRAAFAGLHQHDQTDLLRPFVDRYVAELPQMWVDHHRQESIDLTERLFPLTIIEDATIAAVTPALEHPDVPEAGKRLVREQLDELQRALRTRALDAPA